MSHYFRLINIHTNTIQPKKDIFVMYTFAVVSYIIFNIVQGAVLLAFVNGTVMFAILGVFGHHALYPPEYAVIEDLLERFKTLETIQEKEEFINSCKRLSL